MINLPAFTKTMQDAGELPPIGTTVEVWFDDGTVSGWCEATTVGNHPHSKTAMAFSLLGEHDYKLVWSMQYRPARTPLEIEIESLMLSWGHESNELHANNVVYATIQQMLEMGYSK